MAMLECSKSGALRGWENYRDNYYYLCGYEDEKDNDTLLSKDCKHLIVRRSGTVVWYAHKCVNCGAGTDNTIIWTRRYYWSGGSYIDEDEMLYDVRFFEGCIDCHRTMSWEYQGVTELKWKKPEVPNWIRVRDSQRSKVYSWQGVLYHVPCKDPSSWEETVLQVNGLFDDFNMQRPEIVKLPSSARKSWMVGRSVMKLAEGWGQRRWVQVHEFSHALVAAIKELGLVKTRIPGHGSLFMAVYILMAERYLGIDAEGFSKSAKSFGIRVDSLSETREMIEKVRSACLVGTPTCIQEDEDSD
jgi:hypothetical protein